MYKIDHVARFKPGEDVNNVEPLWGTLPYD